MATNIETNDRKSYLTRGEAASRISISVRHLDDLVRAGIIPSVRLGRKCVRIPVVGLDSALKRLETGGIKSDQPASGICSAGKTSHNKLV